MIAVLGSGFGLYGYLPALIESCSEQVVLPARYRNAFDSRPELLRFARHITFETDERSAIDRASGVVIARRPVDQPELVLDCLARQNIRQLILEKPLASTPEESVRLLASLERSKRAFRIAYVFRHTNWGRHFLHAASRGNQPLSLRWDFMAHHFRHDIRNWKRFTLSGGGVIRFYGIQLIALAAEAGFSDVVISRSGGQSPDEIHRWNATLTGRGLPECEIAVHAQSLNSAFRATQGGDSVGQAHVFADLLDPFSECRVNSNLSNALDRRVDVLGMLCHSVNSGTNADYAWYGAAIELWQKIEKQTQFEPA